MEEATARLAVDVIIYYVNDGSTDATSMILAKVAEADRREPVFRIRRHVHLMMVNPHQPVCALLGAGEKLYCRWPAPFVDTRTFSYGWNVYLR